MDTNGGGGMAQRKPFSLVLRQGCLSFCSMVPLILGVVGLVGLFRAFIDPRRLATFFHGNALMDTLVGTLAGAGAAGNPLISYIVGGELLDNGVSMYAVSAFILSWVTLGFVQLPMEVELFGAGFTIRRNVLTFLFTMLIAVLTTLTVRMLS